MRTIIAALIIAAAVPSHAAYFDTLISDPSHPKISLQALYTSKLDFDGGVSDVAAVYHKADPSDCLWPKALLNAGFPPISWTLLELGAGGNRQTGFAHAGASINAAPTLLGPLVSGLKSVGGKAAAFGDLLVNPSGGGLKLSVGWKSNVIQNGGVLRFNELRFPPRYGIGYTYQF